MPGAASTHKCPKPSRLSLPKSWQRLRATWVCLPIKPVSSRFSTECFISVHLNSHDAVQAVRCVKEQLCYSLRTWTLTYYRHTHTHIRTFHLKKLKIKLISIHFFVFSFYYSPVFMYMLCLIYMQLSTMNIQWGSNECQPPPKGKCYLGVNLSDAFRFHFYWPSNLTLTGA